MQKLHWQAMERLMQLMPFEEASSSPPTLGSEMAVLCDVEHQLGRAFISNMVKDDSHFNRISCVYREVRLIACNRLVKSWTLLLLGYQFTSSGRVCLS